MQNSVNDIIWAAGLFDGEGCIRIAKRNRKNRKPSVEYQLALKVKMTHMPTIEKLYDIFQIGYLRREKPGKNNVKISWCWEVWNSEVMQVLSKIKPYCITKAAEIEIAMEFGSTVCPSLNTQRKTIDDEIIAKRHDYYQRLRLIKAYEWSER